MEFYLTGTDGVIIVKENLVSIIVPVFNVESKLRNCLDSIIGQSYRNIEIIIIDDGSEDSSSNICDEYALKYKNITSIHKKNGGTGMARNIGIEKSNGKYITFIDSDDCIKSNMIAEMTEVAEKYNVEMVSSNFIYNGVYQESPVKEGIYEGNEIKSSVLSRMLGNHSYKVCDQFCVSACTKLYLSEIIKKNNLKYSTEKRPISEDMDFNFNFLCKCNRIYVLDKAYYYYNYNPLSLTHSYDRNRFNLIIDMYKKFLSKIAIEALEEDSEIRLSLNFLGLIIACFKLEVLYVKNNGKRKAIQNISIMINNMVLHDMVKVIPYKKLSIQQNIINLLIRVKSARGIYLVCKLQNIRKGGLIN